MIIRFFINYIPTCIPEVRQIPVVHRNVIAEESQDDSGSEMEDWGSDLEAPLNPDSSVESVIMVATPLPVRRQAPPLPQTPLRPRHVSPIVV